MLPLLLCLTALNNTATSVSYYMDHQGTTSIPSSSAALPSLFTHFRLLGRRSKSESVGLCLGLISPCCDSEFLARVGSKRQKRGGARASVKLHSSKGKELIHHRLPTTISSSHPAISSMAMFDLYEAGLSPEISCIICPTLPDLSFQQAHFI